MSSLKLSCKTVNGEECVFKTYSISEDGKTLVLTVDGLPTTNVKTHTQTVSQLPTVETVETVEHDNTFWENTVKFYGGDELTAVIWGTWTFNVLLMFVLLLCTWFVFVSTSNQSTIRFTALLQNKKSHLFERVFVGIANLFETENDKPKLKPIRRDEELDWDTHKEAWGMWIGIDICVLAVVFGLVHLFAALYDSWVMWLCVTIFISLFVPKIVHVKTVEALLEQEEQDGLY